MTASQEQPILSVSELTNSIKKMLEHSFPHVWVQGEVSNFRKQGASGHLYFTLKDANSQIAALMFRGDATALRQLPKDGDQVIVRGELNVYGRSGKYQMIARTLRLTGVGELLQLLEERKRKIHERGWFSSIHKQPLPHLPKTIGVVTSPTGAAIQDIVRVLSRRFSGFHLILNPVRVQGEAAAGEIAQAIEQFNEHHLADVLIVGRGGGSLEDLWAFNEECVAAAIFNSTIPIVAAVGHETDHCIAEYVADMRAPTPSAAAEMVMAEKAAQQQQLSQRQQWLDHTIKEKVRHYSSRLQMAQRHPLVAAPKRLVEPWFQWLDDCRQQLALQLKGQARYKRQQLYHAYNLLKQLLQRKSSTVRATFEASQLHQRCNRHMQRIVNQKRTQLATLTRAIAAAHPQQLLARGYTILFSEKEGLVITSVEQLSKKTHYQLMFADGKARITIEEIE